MAFGLRIALGVVALSTLGAPAVARADAFGVFGFGAAGLGEANARVARADDGTAAYYAPGGLALGSGAHAEVSTQAIVSGLKAAGQRPSFEDPIGLQIALDTDVPFKGFLEDRIRVGVGVHALPSSVLRVVVREEGTPQLPYYDNRTQRLVVLPSVGVRLASWLGIGASANVLAGLGGSDDVRPGTSRTDEGRIDQVGNTVVAPVLGVRVDPLASLHLALTWRQRFGVDVHVATVAEVGGLPLDATVDRHDALFDPAQLTFGAAWDVTSKTSLEVDATYARWKSWSGPYFDVSASLPGVSATSIAVAPPFRDTIAVRAAAATTLSLGEPDLVLHFGAGYEPSMLGDAAQGATNLVDANKVIVATGATLVLREAVGYRTVRVGLGLQAHVLPTRASTKTACTATPCPANEVVGPSDATPSRGITDPGYPKLTGGGVIGAGALSIGVDL